MAGSDDSLQEERNTQFSLGAVIVSGLQNSLMSLAKCAIRSIQAHESSKLGFKLRRIRVQFLLREHWRLLRKTRIFCRYNLNILPSQCDLTDQA
jgi:hypothetical protein